MKKELARYKFPSGEIDVIRVMARAERYAMVRRKGAMPFVVSEKDLLPMPPGNQTTGKTNE